MGKWAMMKPATSGGDSCRLTFFAMSPKDGMTESFVEGFFCLSESSTGEARRVLELAGLGSGVGDGGESGFGDGESGIRNPESAGPLPADCPAGADAWSGCVPVLTDAGIESAPAVLRHDTEFSRVLA